MIYASKYLYPLLMIFLSGLASLTLSACGGDEAEVSNPTPVLVTVVFATEAPTATAAVAQTTPTATEAVAEVGFGASTAEPGSVLLAADRPADVNPLTGLKVDDPALLQRRPLMVRVGNDPGARPQVSLNEADLVYEEIVEWWVTRFTAVYLSHDPQTIAPIRSARLINLQLAPQYQAALAHSGGSDPVRWELSQSEIVNLDEFFVPEPYFYRPNEGWQTRLAFDAQAGRDYLDGEGLDGQIKLRGFVFTDNLELDKLPKQAVIDAEEVTIPYPRQTSLAEWSYDPQSGKYVRSTTGELMLDFNGDQITAANVIIYFAEHQETDIVEDSNGATSVRIIVNGRGAAWIARDGKLLKANWDTDGQETPMFIFDDGQPAPLKPGNSWIEVVPLDYEIEIDGVAQGIKDPAEAPVDIEAVSENPTATPRTTLTPIGARPAATPDSP
jgi:hypothetical protein